MLAEWADELSLFFYQTQRYQYPWLGAIGLLWVINLLDWFAGLHLDRFGTIPRRRRGLIGILVSPIVHQNFNHLFFNTIPLYVFGLILLARGVTEFVQVTLFIVLGSGVLVWLLARRARHIGASGVISGYFGYILITAYFQPNITMIFVGIMVMYYFGGIFLGLFPRCEKTSWESHLYGFISGLCVAGYWYLH